MHDNYGGYAGDRGYEPECDYPRWSVALVAAGVFALFALVVWLMFRAATGG